MAIYIDNFNPPVVFYTRFKLCTTLTPFRESELLTEWVRYVITVCGIHAVDYVATRGVRRSMFAAYINSDVFEEVDDLIYKLYTSSIMPFLMGVLSLKPISDLYISTDRKLVIAATVTGDNDVDFTASY